MKAFIKSLTLVFLALVLLVQPAWAETKAADPYVVHVEKGYLAVRSAPAFDASNEVEKLYNGDIFYVSNWLDGDYWYGFSKNGIEGYVNKNYLVADSGFNIASNLKYTPDGGDTILENDYFSVQFPAYIDWEYEVVNNTTLKIYHSGAKKDGFGGTVLTIMAYDWGDNSYEEFPSWAVAGSSADKKYIAVLPTDVQFNPKDSVQASEYREMLQIAEDMDCNDEDAYNLFKVK